MKSQVKARLTPRVIPGTPSTPSFGTTLVIEKFRDRKKSGTPGRLTKENASPVTMRGTWKVKKARSGFHPTTGIERSVNAARKATVHPAARH